MIKTYFVIEKLINEKWEEWVVFDEPHSLDDAIETFVAGEDFDKEGDFRIIKRTDQVINKTLYGKE